VRHVGIRTADPERLADFYKFVFGMKEVGRSETAVGAAIYLSDRTISLGLTKGTAAPGAGIQVLGFQVPGLGEVEEQIKKPLGLTYPGEPPLKMQHPADGPYRVTQLRDPDGNCLELSEEGWPV
jgi:catechol 2,3-dioxygenase-like lactoylglutathione lyase family enzyme